MDYDYEDYIGDEEDGCYVRVTECNSRFWLTVTVDSNTGHFVDDLLTDEECSSLGQAQLWGRTVAIDWCLTNGVHWDGEEVSNG